MNNKTTLKVLNELLNNKDFINTINLLNRNSKDFLYDSLQLVYQYVTNDKKLCLLKQSDIDLLYITLELYKKGDE